MDRNNPFGSPLPSLGLLLDTLGEGTLRLVSDRAGRDLTVTQTVLREPGRDVPEAVRGLLLGLGLDIAGQPLADVVQEAARCGYAGLAMKSWGQDPAPAARLADAAGIALVVVDDSVEWLQLDRLISTALSGTGTADDVALSSVAVGDLFSLATAIATATGGATAIEDLSRRVLAYSAIPGQPIDDERREGILGRQVPDLPINDAQYAQLYRTAGAVEYPAADRCLGRLAATVRAGTEPLGSVWVVVPPEGLRPDAPRLVAAAAEVTGLHLLRNRSDQDAVRQRRTDLLRRLIEQDDPAAARQLRLTNPARLCVVALQARTGDGTTDQPVVLRRLLDVVSLELEARLGPVGCVDTEGRIYALVPLGDPGQPKDDALVSALRSAGHALRTPLTAGVSRPLRGAWTVSPARAEADRVLDLISSGAAQGPVAHAAHLIDRLRLLELADQHPDPAAVSELAAAVLADDAGRGGDHADLLLSWLGHLGDARATAEELGVHVNTVRYRLDRLSRRHGLDRSSPDQLLLLWLALRLRQLAGRS